MPDRSDEDPSLEQDQRHPPRSDPAGEPPQGDQHRSQVRVTRVRIVAVLALAGIIVVVVVTPGGGSNIQPADARIAAEARRIDVLLAGIPQSGNALGSPAAPVTLEYFGDLECPTSRAFTLAALPSLITRWVRGGELRIEYRSLETATRQAAVFTAQQIAALAAGMQDKAWYYIELFYHEQGGEGSGYVTTSYLNGLAKQTPGLNLALWSKDRQEPPLAAEVATDEQTAAYEGFHSTPSFLVRRTGSKQAQKLLRFSVTEPTAFNTAIEAVLSQGSRARFSPASYSETTSRSALADSIRRSPGRRQGSPAC